MRLVEDWEGFGQRLTGTGTSRFENVYVEPDEFQDWGPVGQPRRPTVMGAFLQLFLQAVTAGVLRAVRRDAAALVRRRARSFGHASAEAPAEDVQVLQVVGEIAADAFAAEAIVLAAVSRIDEVVAPTVDGSQSQDAAYEAQVAAA